MDSSSESSSSTYQLLDMNSQSDLRVLNTSTL